MPACFRPIIILALAGALTAGEALDWPGWQVQPPSTRQNPAVPLRDDPAAAKLLWRSQERIANGFPIGPPNQKTPLAMFGGNCASPVLAGGRIYLNYYLPSPACRTHFANADLSIEDGDLKFKSTADEFVLCLDAANGATVWRAVYEQRAINSGWSRPDPRIKGFMSHCTPAVADGRVFALGQTGRLYALDARTGERLWEVETGPMAQTWTLLRRYLQKTGIIYGSTGKNGSVEKYLSGKGAEAFLAHLQADHPDLLQPETGVVAWTDRGAGTPRVPPGKGSPAEGGSAHGGCFFSSPCVVDDLVIVNNQSGVVAFDVATGAVRWTNPRRFSSIFSPYLWRHQGRALLIIGGSCLDARDGKELWSVPLEQEFTAFFHEEVLLTNSPWTEATRAIWVETAGEDLNHCALKRTGCSPSGTLRTEVLRDPFRTQTSISNSSS